MQKLRRFRNIALLIVAVLSISLMGVGYSVYIISGENKDIVNVPVDKVEVNNIKNIISNIQVDNPLTYDNSHGIVTNDKLLLQLTYNSNLVTDVNGNPTVIPSYNKDYSQTGILFSIKIDDAILYKLIANKVMVYQDFLSIGNSINNLYQLKQDCIFKYKDTTDVEHDCFQCFDLNNLIEIHIPASPVYQFISKDKCYKNSSNAKDGFYLHYFRSQKIYIEFDFGILGENGEFNQQIVYNNLNNKVHIDLAMEIY